MTKDDCKIKFLDDNKTLIKCQWVDDICLQEGREIKNCTQAENLTDLSEKQCSSLVTSGRCIKGPVGCKEIKDCSEINFEVEESICEEFTKEEEIKKCVSDIETKGCKQIIKNCLGSNNKDLCSQLNTTEGGYKCYFNGNQCDEANSCESVKDTNYDVSSEDLKGICELFDNCEPYENKCKTKPIPTTIITTLPTTIITIIHTTIPKTLLTTIPTITITTNPTIIPSIISTTTLTTLPTTILKTITTNPTIISSIISTTTSTTLPTTILKTITTNTTIIPSIIPSIALTTLLTTIQTNLRTSIQIKMPTTIITTIPTVIETTITATIPAKTETTTIKTTIPTTIKINMPTNIPTTKLATRQTTIITKSPTYIQTTIIISKAIPITTQIFSTQINKKTDSSSISKASIPTTIFSTITNIEHTIIPETTIITNIITRSNIITTNIPTPQPTMKPSKIISTTIPIEKIKTTIISTTKPTIFQTNTPFTDPITAPEIINTTIPRINSTEIFTTIIRTTETIINEITSIPSIESIPIKTANPTFTPSSNSNEIHNPKPIQMTTNILPTLASDEQTNLHSTIQSDLISTNIKSSNKYSLSEIISEQITLNLNSSIPLSLNLISTTLQNNIIRILPTTNIKNNIFSTLIKDTDLIPLKNDEETLLIYFRN